jgi:hypothetical protein
MHSLAVTILDLEIAIEEDDTPGIYEHLNALIAAIGTPAAADVLTRLLAEQQRISLVPRRDGPVIRPLAS